MNKLFKPFTLTMLGVCFFIISPIWATQSKQTQAIQQRIAPLGQVNVVDDKDEAASQTDTTQEKQKPQAMAADKKSVKTQATTTAAAEKEIGKEIYQKKCVACHASGLAGAPKLGDKVAWSPRVKQGLDVLLQNVKKGMGAMPPMGTCIDCSDQELLDAINYMLAQSDIPGS